MLYAVIGVLSVVSIVLLFSILFFLFNSKKSNLKSELENSNTLKDNLTTQLISQAHQIENLLKENENLKTDIKNLSSKFEDYINKFIEFKTGSNNDLYQLKTYGKNLENILNQDLKNNLIEIGQNLSKEEKNSTALSDKYKEISDTLTKVNKELGDFITSSSDDTKQILNIFTNKQKRGAFGEISLYLILENYLGNSSDIWEKQKTLKDKKVPDAIIKMSVKDGYENIVVDSKFPSENFQRYISENSPNREKYWKLFKEDIKKHIKDVKAYVTETNSVSFALLFLPSELIFSEICNSKDTSELIAKAYKDNVLIVSPSTLVMTLFWFRRLSSEQKISKTLNKHFDFIKKQIENGISLSEKFDKAFQKTFEQADKLKDSLTLAKDSAGKISKVFQKIEDKAQLVDKENLIINSKDQKEIASSSSKETIEVASAEETRI